VDAVYVAVPHSLHEALTLDYLDAGKHVLCEKPLALNAWQAARMVAAARERRLFLMEAVWSRFLPAYRILGDLVAEGRIGRPLLVESDIGYRMPVLPEHRLFDSGLAGGATLDVGTYPFQLATLLLGPPTRVSATGAVGATGVDEVVAFTSHHRGGGVASGKAAIRVGLACTARISGEDGWIGLPAPMYDPRRLRVTTAAGGEDIDAGYDGDGLRFEVHEVHRCLQAGLTESPVVPLDESLVLARALDDVRAQVGVSYPGEYD
jgi:predicted dehydrogenase